MMTDEERDERARRAEEREKRLRELGFEEVTEEQRARNLELFLLDLGIKK